MRCAKEWLAEHRMRRCNSGEGPNNLRGHITRYFTPRQPALRSIGQRHGWIEMRSRNGAESENESYQRRAGSESVGKQS